MADVVAKTTASTGNMMKMLLIMMTIIIMPTTTSTASGRDARSHALKVRIVHPLSTIPTQKSEISINSQTLKPYQAHLASLASELGGAGWVTPYDARQVSEYVCV